MILNLKRPFPMLEKPKDKLLVALLFGLFIFLFLRVFQPFGISQVTNDKTILTLGFGAITLVGILLSFFALPPLFDKFYGNSNWTVGRMLIFMTFPYLLISIANYYYSLQFAHGEHPPIGWIRFIGVTFSVGIFPTFFLVYFMEKYLTQRNEQVASNMSGRIEDLRHQDHQEGTHVFCSENGKEELNIPIEQLICIKAEGNYAEVYYRDADQVKTHLVRNSLVNLYQLLKHYELIKHCHRSFIVNFYEVDHVSGNARNYALHIAGLEFAIPVSRSFPKDFILNLPDQANPT